MDCIFCDFVKGEKEEHKNGLPFKPLRETKQTLTFLDMATVKEGTILVIPKKHYQMIEEMPNSLLSKIIKEVKLASQALTEENEGTNISYLVNNGASANQKIPHFHFHVIPRNSDDKIVEEYPRAGLEKSEFLKVHDKIRKTLQKKSENNLKTKEKMG